jgi:two-component system CitB family sensor kinase
VFNDGFTTKPAEPDRQRGLGLALVHRLVRNSGGTIGFTSVASGGTRFTVVLPIAVRPEPAVGA